MPDYIKSICYLVGVAFILDKEGPDEKNVTILGTYGSLSDAKAAVEANANLIIDNDKQCLTIYKVNLEEAKVYDFFRKDLFSAFQKAQEQTKIDAEKMLKFSEENKYSPRYRDVTPISGPPREVQISPNLPPLTPVYIETINKPMKRTWEN